LVAPWKFADHDDHAEFYDYEIDTTIADRVQDIVMFTADDEDDQGKQSLTIFQQALG
jgi:hypothetical protein